MGDEDRERLANALHGNPNDDVLCVGTTNVRLRDTHGRHFSVTACHTRMRKFGHDPTYIVGVAEPEERMHIPTAGCAVPVPLNRCSTHPARVRFYAYDFNAISCSDLFVYHF